MQNPTRRKTLAAMGAIAASIGATVFATSTPAQAQVSADDLTITDDQTTTDGGRLSSLTVSIPDGVATYDGLDTDAAQVTVALSAAPTGGDLTTAGNQLDTATETVSESAELNTRAGTYNYTFTDVDVFQADDISRQQFAATEDGSTKHTDIDFRVELTVEDNAGNILATAATITTTTISVTNEAQSSNAGGNGSASAGGSNQSP